MAIIVRHRKTNKKYILLGTGFGAFKAVRPSFFGGNLLPHEEEGIIKMISVSDKNGNINWFYSDNLQVVEVDGIKVTEFEILYEKNEIKQETKIEQDIEICPGCGTKVPLDQTICSQCGLTLIDNTYKKISDLAKQKRN